MASSAGLMTVDSEPTKVFYDESRAGRPLRRHRRAFMAVDALFKGHRNVPPNLNGQNDRRRQQKGTNCYVRYGRDHHRQLRLDSIVPPRYAREEREKAQAELGDQQRQKQDCRPAHGFNLRIER